MGIFSSKKKTFVSSTSYNLAGDEADRPQFLKSLIIGKTFGESTATMAETITGAYLRGPGVRFRNFAAWGESSGYNDAINLTTSDINSGNNLNLTVLKNYLKTLDGGSYDVDIQSAELGFADYTDWVDEFIVKNFPSSLPTEYTFDLNETTKIVTVTFVNGSTSSFLLEDFDPYARYISVAYTKVDSQSSGSITTGSTIVLDDDEPFPSTDGWTEIYYTDETVPVVLETTTTTVVHYSDGRPDETTTTTTTENSSYHEIHGKWEQINYLGESATEDSIKSQKDIQYQDQVGSIITTSESTSTTEVVLPGLTRTTTVTTETDSVDLDKTYRIDEQQITDIKWSTMRFFRYRFNTGNALLDPMFAERTESGGFFPFIPIRLNNKFVSPTYLPDLYALSKKALKKGTGGSYDEMVENLKDNPSLKDIDYAYVNYGVSLNTQEMASRKYIYKFFQAILYDLAVDPSGDYSAWQIQWAAADAAVNTWTEWKLAQSDTDDPLYGTPQPPRIAYPDMPSRTIQVRADTGTAINYDITLEWVSLSESTEIGVAQTGAKKGDIFLSSGPLELYPEGYYVKKNVSRFARVVDTETLYIKWQDEENSYRQLTVVGLKHLNNVYRGKKVIITAKQALEDDDESGFIVPLHVDIYRSMGIKDATQMATACSYLTLNSYTVVKQKWYQTTIFKIILIVVIIVISIIFPPFAATATAVGTSLGFTGIAAIIVGVVVTAIASTILIKILVKVATALFGEKIGAIVGTIAAIALIAYGGAEISGETLTSSIANMSRAELIINLSNAVGQGVAAYYQASAELTAQAISSFVENYETEMDILQELYDKNLTSATNIIDPMMLTDATNVLIESSNSFLQRTLMTGSDVADLSFALVNNFADITLSTNVDT